VEANTTGQTCTAAVLATLLLTAACHAAQPTSAGDAAPEAATSERAADGGARLEWQQLRAAIAADGMTLPVHFALSGVARAFALRAYAPDWHGAPPCVALRDVVINAAQTWVGPDAAADSGDYCTQCEQRVAVGTGYGMFILPSAAEAALAIDSVSARLVLHDCLTLTAQRRSPGSPSELSVELASWSPPQSSARLRLPLAVLVATRYGLSGDLLETALEALQHTWSGAGIQIMPEPSIEIAAPEQPVVFSAVDHAALVSLAQRARTELASRSRDANWPVLILTPCLRRLDLITSGQTEPWAITPHLPGGAAVGDEPDQIFIAAERCEGLAPGPRFSDGAQLGAIMAHELGHYLGLYHVAEADGRQDALLDTEVSDANLMRANPAPSATALSASQIEIARRHIAFATSP
jgi:hypothetical protein